MEPVQELILITNALISSIDGHRPLLAKLCSKIKKLTIILVDGYDTTMEEAFKIGADAASAVVEWVFMSGMQRSLENEQEMWDIGVLDLRFLKCGKVRYLERLQDTDRDTRGKPQRIIAAVAVNLVNQYMRWL
jgi:hypothetical protein